MFVDNSAMNVFMTHISALVFWRTVAAAGQSVGSYPPARSFGNCSTTKDDYISATYFNYGSGPLHASLPHGVRLPQGEEFACHAIRRVPCAGSFRKLRQGLFVSTPERCYIELAQMLDLDELVLLGFELCGFYVFVPNGNDDYTEISAPLTNVGKLKHEVSLYSGVPGIAKAREALRWVLDCSRSPMETISEQRLVRQVRIGGYRVKIPQSNAPFKLGSTAAKMAGRDSFTCDLLWPEERVVLEYDSKEHHSDPEQAAYDAERASIIEYDGGNLISVTPRIEQSIERFDAMAQRLFKLLGIRYRKPTAEQMSKKLELRRKLYRAERRIKDLTSE